MAYDKKPDLDSHQRFFLIITRHERVSSSALYITDIAHVGFTFTQNNLR